MRSNLSTIHESDLPSDLEDMENVATRSLLMRIDAKLDRLMAFTGGNQTWLKLSEAARLAGVSRGTFERHYLPHCRTRRVGKRVEVRRTDVDVAAGEGE